MEAEAKEVQDDGLSNGLDITTTLEEDENSDEDEEDSEEGSESESDDEGLYLSGEEDSPDSRDPRAKVLSVLELEDLFVKAAPDLSSELHWF